MINDNDVAAGPGFNLPDEPRDGCPGGGCAGPRPTGERDTRSSRRIARLVVVDTTLVKWRI